MEIVGEQMSLYWVEQKGQLFLLSHPLYMFLFFSVQSYINFQEQILMD